MEGEGALISHYPLLIQKTLADKLSDKVQVIIAPTPAAGRFIGSNLIGVRDSVGADEDAAADVSPKTEHARGSSALPLGWQSLYGITRRSVRHRTRAAQS